MTEPKFTPGDRVWINSVQKAKTVVAAYRYKGAEWAYKLVDDDGVHDEGWREDELRRPTIGDLVPDLKIEVLDVMAHKGP